MGTVSAVSAVLTPFGGHATNLAAITAAIAAGPDAHPDPRRRYIAGITCALANLAARAGAGWLIGAYTDLPAPMIAAVAAVALLPSLTGALSAALAAGPATSPTTTAAMLTLVVTASGLNIAGIGSALWALVAGLGTWLVLRGSTPNAAALPKTSAR